jgi:hypothetical protein
VFDCSRPCSMYDFKTTLEHPDCASTVDRVARALRTLSESMSKLVTLLIFLATPWARLAILH